MNVGSLFSGIGGIELGFERAGGFKTAWFVENEIHAQTVLRKHWPEALIYDDITQVDFKTIPKVDILTGGFPCQDISNAGKRAGITGSRSSLWKHYLRAISEIRPKYILAENVAVLTRRGLNVVLADLASVGYDAEWHCISAVSVGASHRRDRVFIIGFRAEDVAYACCERNECNVGFSFEGRKEEKVACAESSCSSSNVADACGAGLQRCDCERGYVTGQSVNVADTTRGNVERYAYEIDSVGKISTEREYITARNESSRGIWSFEPNVGRVADGVSLRVDRIKRLGNAVVPQCAEVFALAIKEFEELKRVGGLNSPAQTENKSEGINTPL